MTALMETVSPGLLHDISHLDNDMLSSISMLLQKSQRRYRNGVQNLSRDTTIPFHHVVMGRCYTLQVICYLKQSIKTNCYVGF